MTLDELPAGPGIYCLTHRASGRRYVGLAKCLAKRVPQHFKGKACQYIGNAIRKHGAAAFDIEVLEHVADPATLPEREQYHVARLGTVSPGGFNLTIGGDANPTEHPETRAKLSARTKAQMSDPAARAKIGARAKARLADPSARAAHGARIKAQMSDPAAREANRARGKARMADPAARAKATAAVNAYVSSPEGRAHLSARLNRHFALLELNDADWFKRVKAKRIREGFWPLGHAE